MKEAISEDYIQSDCTFIKIKIKTAKLNNTLLKRMYVCDNAIK